MADVTFFAVFIVIFDQLAAAAVRPPAALAAIGPNAEEILQKLNFKKIWENDWSFACNNLKLLDNMKHIHLLETEMLKSVLKYS